MLRGLGAALALPLLDSMVPALTALSKTAAAPVRRLGVFYVPNGMSMPYWFPKAEGRSQRVAGDAAVAGGASRIASCCCGGLGRRTGEPGQGRRRPRALGGHLPDRRAVQDHRRRRRVRRRVSMDQIAAKQFAKETQLASLELGIESNAMLGSCDGGASCAYTNTIAWSNADHAAADRKRPARGVRAAVRHQRQHRSRRRGSRASSGTAASSTSSTSRLAGLERVIGPQDQVEARRVPRLGSRHRAAHPDGRGAEHARAAGRRSAGRRSRPTTPSTPS